MRLWFLLGAMWMAPMLPCAAHSGEPQAVVDAGAGGGLAAVERCVTAYAATVERAYSATAEAARRMRAAIEAFCAAPSQEGLERARTTWIAARELYGRTEAFRFGNGPIDSTRGGVETFVNAWPVDESYIDAIDGAAAPGIIANPSKYPSVGKAILRVHNQRGGETNVCTGWHAIEFLLWGQDRSPRGPGDRSFRDFVDGAADHADRRREFLLEVTDLLCDDLAKLESAWADRPGSYRSRFVADRQAALRSVLCGVALLSGFEMSGERLAAALESRDQEQEHSCFSDTTDRDFKAGLEGIALVLRGANDDGVIAVVRERDGAAAQALVHALAHAETCMQAMPNPFDAAIQSSESSPERGRLVAIMESLESLSEATTAAARALGYTLPTEPQG
ncbi:MAG: imelysin family protein [Bacteroidia bacterium]|jgi:putative iron-regulated protein|nr:imelysin family protein [Bacteroidia bacterium]